MEEAIKRKEGERILKLLKEDSYCIALAIEGTNLSSVELAEKLDKLFVSGQSHISFIIGGSLGLSDEVLSRADYSLVFQNDISPSTYATHFNGAGL